MTDDQLNTARRLIAEGLSIRKASLEIGIHESTLRSRLEKNRGGETVPGILGRFKPTFTPEEEQ